MWTSKEDVYEYVLTLTNKVLDMEVTVFITNIDKNVACLEELHVTDTFVLPESLFNFKSKTKALNAIIEYLIEKDIHELHVKNYNLPAMSEENFYKTNGFIELEGHDYDDERLVLYIDTVFQKKNVLKEIKKLR